MTWVALPPCSSISALCMLLAHVLSDRFTPRCLLLPACRRACDLSESCMQHTALRPLPESCMQTQPRACVLCNMELYLTSNHPWEAGTLR